jgi:predicted HTH transcriptional regulator
MISSIEELIESVKNHTLLEHRAQNVELKSSWSQECGKKISAFANRLSEGPYWMCIGISDDGNLCGRKETWAKTTEEAVSQHINQYLDPQIACLGISCKEYEGQWFVVVKYSSPGSVVFWNNSAYKAAGTTIEIMTPPEVMQLTVSLPGLTDISAQPWDGVFDENKAHDYIDTVAHKRRGTTLDSIGELSIDEALRRIGIYGKKTHYILFGNIPYRVVKYDNLGNPISNETITGLFGILQPSFLNEIQDWSKVQLGVTEPPYPEKTLKEGLANAVAHAAYVEKNGDIIIELFPDRLCISNLCLRDSQYFANKWFSHGHKTINGVLMEALRLAGIVDELGRGKNLIFSESLKNGKRAPEVIVEQGGRYDRWRLNIYGGERDDVQLRIYERLRNLYPDEQKALIANALVLWRGHTVSDIRQYIDGESSRTFADVLGDLHGPIFYYEKEDQIILRRWVSVLLGEGKDSKQLSPAEEEDLYNLARRIQTEFHRGYITPKELREYAAMGHTHSETVLSSHILKKWLQQGKIVKVKKGLYRFLDKQQQLMVSDLVKMLSNFDPSKIQ